MPLHTPLVFSPLTPQLLAGVASIACHAPDPWTRQDLTAAIDGSPHRYNLVAYLQSAPQTPVAFACFLTFPPTADLQMVAVAPASRGQGIGRQLLQECFHQLKGAGCTQCLLELRCSNTPALRLYQGLGFSTLAIKPKLYSHPSEDGLLLSLPL